MGLKITVTSKAYEQWGSKWNLYTNILIIAGLIKVLYFNFFPKYITGTCIVKGAIIFKGLEIKWG